jgi:P27 family predicted phage terminase small subunit
VHKLQEKLDSEPKATPGLPSCPDHLKGLARKAWRFWVGELVGMGLDKRPDAMMLEGACASYQTYVRMHQRVDEQGELVAKKERNPTTGQMEVVDVRAHPGLAIRDRALMQMKAFCSEFGLSPVSRVRLSVDNQDGATEDLWALLSTPREPRKKLLPEEAVQ